jgi:splicing factor 3B subunit 3
MKAASNLRQLVLALAGGDLVYYELDSAGSLTEVMTTTLECEVSSLDIGPIPHNHQRSNFLAVGLSDHTTRIFDLTPDSCLKKLSVQTFPCSVGVCVYFGNAE